MHIHIHNEPGGIDLPITLGDLAAAGIAGHHVTIGSEPEDFNAQAATVEALVAPPWELKRFDLFAAPRLRLVQTTSAGVDSLAPFDRIPGTAILANNRGTHAEKAGEYALMAMLMLVNRIPAFATAQRAQVWRRDACGLLAAQRVTIIGLGSLGGAAAMQASRLGAAVTGIRQSGAPHPHCKRVLPPAAIDAVLRETDILLLACPLTAATRNLLSAARIALLPAGAGVINIGRGGLVDETALLDALECCALGGAVLDVFHQEPLPPGHRAWDVKNLIITPHMSSDDPSTYNAATLQIFRRNLDSLENGALPPTAVDRVKGY
jgi:phosphoglycerate dehydrogenase-like enzyme